MPSSTHILYAVDHLGGQGHRGGPTISRWDTLVALGAAAGRLTIYCPEQPPLPAWAKQYIKADVDWLVPPRTGRIDMIGRSRFSVLKQCYNEMKAVRAFAQQVERIQPDILWVDHTRSHRMLNEYRDWPVDKRVFCMRGSPEQTMQVYADGDSDLERVCKEMATYTHFAAVSLRVAEMWRALPGLEHLNVLHVPNCARDEEIARVLAEPREKVRARLGIAKDECAIVCPASVQIRKGQDLIVKSWGRWGGTRQSVRCYCVGPISSGRGGWSIQQSVTEAGLEDMIRFTGFRDNILEFLYAADLVLVPSREEALPLAILEAMALGRPIVASDVCGIPELIEDGRHGLLFPSGDADAMSMKLEGVLPDVDLRSQLGMTAQTRYQECYARAHHIAHYGKAVRQLYG